MRLCKLKHIVTTNFLSFHLVLICIAFIDLNSGLAQIDSSIKFDNQEDTIKITKNQLILPVSLLGFGVAGTVYKEFKAVNLEIREEVNEHVTQKFTLDNTIQYVPMSSVYALNAFGVRGKHNFVDRTVILASAATTMIITTQLLKRWTHVQRPDGSTFNSFPSGHTATAFVGAEFVYQEYKDVSIYYGLSAYAIAAGTGFLRIYNNRHWVTDVAAGAGIGILCTKFSYWIFPKIKNLLGIKNQKTQSFIIPNVSISEKGMTFMLRF